jgi:two-component system, OmpR family, alkaline phosphatase synthesis response regulator PhoP
MTDKKNAAQAAEPAGTMFPCNPPPHRILVVDDEPDIRRLNAAVLMDSGYHVDDVEDGAIAWETLQLKSYHLLITDNEMPKVSGVELLKKLHATRMAVPVIMATGTWPHEEFTRQPWLQPAAKLLKPYTIVELLGAVQEVLRATVSPGEPISPPPDAGLPA